MITDDTGNPRRRFLHNAALDDNVASGGLLTNITQALNSAGQNTVLEVYDWMRKLIASIVHHEQHELIENSANPAIRQAYADGYAAGWAEKTTTSPATPPPPIP